jgi:ABC-type nitrate/sulfonate/bicarbonate transport system substrate-binding protein
MTARLLPLAFCAALLAACGSAAPGAAPGASGSAGSSAKPAASTGSTAALTQPARSRSAPASGLTHIKVGFTSKSTGGLYMYLAQDLGIFQKHGLDAEIVIGQSNALDPALLRGDLDFVGTIPTVVQGAEEGLPVRAILVARDHPEYLLVGDTDFSKPEQLKGKQIAGSQPTQSPTQILQQLLRLDGLQPSDYNVIPVANDNARAALVEQHQAQAGILGLAQSFPLLDQGHPLIDSSLEKIYNPSNGLGTSIATIQSRKDLVQRTVDAVLEAIELAQTDKERTVQVTEREFGIKPENAGRLFDMLKSTYAMNGRGNPEGIKYQLELDAKSMQLPAVKTEADVYDWSFLPPARSASSKP